MASKGNSRKSSSKAKTNTAKEKHIIKDYSLETEIALWILILFSLLLTISNLGWGGTVGDHVSGFLFGLMGSFAYLFPFILVFCVFFYIANRHNINAAIKLAGGILLCACICLFLSLLFYGQKYSDPAEAYAMCSTYKTGGGILGAVLARALVPAFGTFGAYAIDLVFIIIALILITGRSFMDPIKRGSRSAGRKLRQGSENVMKDMKARNEAYQLEKAQRQEEELLEQEAEKREPVYKGEAPRRRDRVHNGVSIDNSLILPETGTMTAADGSSYTVDTYPEETRKKSGKKKAEGKNGRSGDKAAASDKMPLPELPSSLQELFGSAPEEGKAESTSPSNQAGKDPFDDFNEDYAVFAESLDDLQPDDFEEDYASFSAEESEVPQQEPEYEVQEVRSTRAKRKPKQTEEEKQQELAEVSMEIEQQETAEEQPAYVYPTIELLDPAKNTGGVNAQQELRDTALKLSQTLYNFGVDAKVTDYSRGPAVTRFEITPNVGVKVSKIVGLADDIKLNLAAADIRIEAPIPGKSAVGIEVPNLKSTMVNFRELLESREFTDSESKVTFAVGKDIGGKVKVANIAKMPHLLIAGATGSGKSVCINTIIMSILYKADPSEVKMIMIDPKVVELSIYNGIPHLLIPVVTDPKKATGALSWAVNEMTLRYEKFASRQVRDINSYNKFWEENAKDEAEKAKEKLPLIVIIVDELADLMMVASKEVEEYICRLAQLARAAGIHLIIATQRPSVNVITGLIKANMPSRIAFAVTSGTDSRTILDMNGAEKLLGKGDMLFDPQGAPKPLRVQGAFVSDDEVQRVVSFIKENNGAHSTSKEVEEKIASSAAITQGGAPAAGEGENGRDEYFADAGKIITDKEKASIGMLQRYLKIGFNRAARIMDQLEEAGVVGPEEGTKPRAVLMSSEQFENYLEENG